MSIVADWRAKTLSPDDAIAPIKSGMKIFIHGAAATPTPLIVALCKRLELENVSLYHLHVAGEIPYAEPIHQGRFFSISFFAGEALRKPIEEGWADFMPIFLADIPSTM